LTTRADSFVPSSLSALTVPSWAVIPGLVHAFFGRSGGVSRGPHASLNASFDVDDEPERVTENRRRIRAHTAPGLRLVTMTQVHGATVAAVTGDTPVGEADAMITTAAGCGLCVLTADCAPILLVAPRSRAVAVVHAGWRGTCAGTVRHAVKRLVEEHGARRSDIRAAVGPTIGVCCYEVAGAIADEIEGRWGPMPAAVRRYERFGEAKARLDLPQVNAAHLIEEGIDRQQIVLVTDCTCCNSEQYFSYRAAFRSGDAGTTGRQLSMIGWLP
jgi:YfiH family protein